MTGVLPRLIWLLVDGLPYWIVERHADALPRLGALMHAGRVRPLTPLWPNCQTPPSLQTLWSGVEVPAQGLTGYDVPMPDGAGPLDYGNGFATYPRDVSMVWDRYADAGKRVRLCGIPFVQAARMGEGLASAIRIFTSMTVYPFVLPADTHHVLSDSGLSLSWTAISVGASLRVSDGSATRFVGTLRREDGWSEVEIGVAADGRPLALRAALFPVGGELRLVCPGFHPIMFEGTDHPLERTRVVGGRKGTPGGIEKLYRDGRLGRSLTDGGDGSAEEILLSGLEDLHGLLIGDMMRTLAIGDADLVVGYTHVVDLLLHEILALHEAEGEDGSRLRAAADELCRRLLMRIDADIARIADFHGGDARILINSDHGMAPVHHVVHPNVLFQELGLLTVTAEGAIDPLASAVFYHPADNGALAVHEERLRACGFDAGRLADIVRSRFADAGLDGGDIIDAGFEDRRLGFSLSLYLQPPRGCRGKATLGQPFVIASKKSGDHTVFQPDDRLCGIAIDAGRPFLSGGAVPLRLIELVPAATSVTEQADGSRS